jgi:hypothetical protein
MCRTPWRSSFCYIKAAVIFGTDDRDRRPDDFMEEEHDFGDSSVRLVASRFERIAFYLSYEES